MEGASRPARDEAAVARFVEQFALILSEGSLPRMTARVFAALLVADGGRLTAAELADRLAVSPAAVSGAVRQLIDLGLVARGRDPGERRDHYVVDDDSWYRTITRRDAMMTRMTDSLADGIDALGPGTPAADRLAETRRFFAFLHAEVAAIMDRWDAQRFADDT